MTLDLTRRANWEQALNDAVINNTDLVFEWGQHDCILWACTACLAMTGFDPGREFRGKYTTREGSAKALREIGDGTLLKTVDARFERKHPPLAQRGDWVMTNGAVGVCMGDHALFVGEERLHDINGAVIHEGFVKIPRKLFEKAWSI